METLCLNTPLGDVTVFAHNQHLVALDWGQGYDSPRTTQNPLLNQTAKALRRYFQGAAEDFSSLPLDPGGTPFQRRVWKQMQAIEIGKARTYGQIAKHLGSSPRAVGTACGANPIPIIIPCHRVVAQKALGGYSGGHGAETKTHLLHLEGYL